LYICWSLFRVVNSVMHPGADLCCLPEAQVKFYAGYCRCASLYAPRQVRVSRFEAWKRHDWSVRISCDWFWICQVRPWKDIHTVCSK
jgi:hypothetical protein